MNYFEIKVERLVKFFRELACWHAWGEWSDNPNPPSHDINPWRPKRTCIKCGKVEDGEWQDIV